MARFKAGAPMSAKPCETCCLSFEDGIWYAVEYLVLTRDFPTFADELLEEVGMDRHSAERCMKKTRYRTGELRRALQIFSRHGKGARA